MELKEVRIQLDRENRKNIIDNFTLLFDSLIQTGVDANEAKKLAEEAFQKASEGKGYFQNNVGVTYPLINLTKDGDLHAVSERVKKTILGAKVIGAKFGKLYAISYVSNGFNGSYGFTIQEYSKSNYNSNSDNGKRTIVTYLEERFTESRGIVTRTLFVEDMVFIITVNYDEITLGSGLNLSNTPNGQAYGCVIDESNYEYVIKKGTIEDNRGADFPLKNMVLAGEKGSISEDAKNAILDVKIFGAKIDCYYRLTMISNGYVNGEKERWGISLEEYPKDTFETTGESKIVFSYVSETLPGNLGNALWQQQSDGIETITVDNGDIACSVTVDRSVISESYQPLFMNLNTPHAPTAIIDPSNYFF